jgi:DNA helicase HerA-like ATPase
VGGTSGFGGGAAGPWYRVLAITPGGHGHGSAEQDYVSILPAALYAAMHRRPFIAGWLSRGGGAPLELITNAGPLPAAPASPRHEPAGERPPEWLAGNGWIRPAGAATGPGDGAPRPGGGGGGAPRPEVSAIMTADVTEPDAGRTSQPAAGAVTIAGVAEQAANGAGRRADGAIVTSGGSSRPADQAAVELLFPAGARGTVMPDGWLADLDRLVWAPCPARQAPPLAAEQGGQHGRHRGPLRGYEQAADGPWQGDEGYLPPFESTLVSLMTRPFGWLVVAEPTDLIDTEIAELSTELNVLRRYEEERARLDVERAERRLAELDAFREAGLWNVRVLAGAASEEELSLLAPVLVGSVGLSGHPYRLRSAEGAHELADALVVTLAGERDGAQVPFAATAGALAALTGLPRGEVPGVRVLEPGCFDVTSEARAAPAIDLGEILDSQDRPVGTFRVPLATLNRHALVAGATGAGKSQTVRHMLEQLTGAGIPWLAIEPVKSEYAAMAGRLGADAQVTVISPADPGAVPLSVNPLAPEPGYPVQAHIDMVRALFLAAFAADEPFPQIMSQALQRVYLACGWDMVTGTGVPGAPAAPVVPTLAQLQRAALEVIDDVGYGRELQADVRGFVDVRLRSLRIGSAGRFFEGGHPADIGELLRRNVVLAIEDVANDEDKAFLIGTLIIRIVEYLRLRARDPEAGGGPAEGGAAAGGLRHVIVIEEAHRLLRAQREGPSAHAVELFASMLAEIRAYGVGIVVAEQIPAKLVPDVVKNTALKVLHRLPAQDDRELVGAAMNLDAGQSRQVVSLEPGVAAVFADGMDRPLRIRVPSGEDRERSGGRPVATPPLSGRRCAACGPECATGRACTLLELRAADLLAGSPDDAWLRIWAEALLLAHLTNRGLPLVPAALRQRWAELAPRLRECVLATVIDRAMAGRALSLRSCYDPERMVAATADTARRMLAGGQGAATLPGPDWVIPQLRWLHEIDRVYPRGGEPPDVFAPAPRLDFPLAGVPDRPDVLIGQRVRGLRRHPLSMELPRNQLPAWNVLLGEDDQRGFTEDLESVVIGASHRGQLRQAAGEMGISGWLENVLSWPRRFIAGAQSAAAAG